MSPLTSLLALTAAFLAVAALERTPLQLVPTPLRRPFLATDAAWYLVATGAGLAFAVALRPLLSPLTVDPVAGAVRDWPAPLLVVAAVALYDAVAFGVHYGIHRSATLWTIHKVHHSSPHLDWLATTRTHVFEHLVRNLPAQAALVAVGVPIRIIAAALAVYGTFAVLGHSNLRLALRWAETVFITPRLHRVHHAPATTQRNFGTVFSWWDRLAGTLEPRGAAVGEALGVPEELGTYPQRFVDALRQPPRQLHERRRRSASSAVP